MNLNMAQVRHFAKDISCNMATLSKGLHDLRLDEKRQELRDRLLNGLKFPGMNERRHQVTESFPQTFQWAFGKETFGEDDFDEGDDSNNGSGKPSNSGSNELHALRR